MRIGYIRVSTDEQNIERQEAALKAAGVEKIFIDKLSGKNVARPGLKEMLAYIRDGDIVIVESYSRLARSLKDLIVQIVQDFDLTRIYRSETIDGRNRIENLRTLYRIAKKELSNQSGINGIKELLQYATLSSSDLDALTVEKPKIPIITVHQAKGLEFKYEFLAGMNDDIFPSYFSTQNGYITEEEKRLFYVAITRAKKRLYISCSGKKSRLLTNIPEQFIDNTTTKF